MRRKLATASWLVAVAVALTVAACGGSSSDDKTSKPSSATTSAKSLKGQTITYWASNQAKDVPTDYKLLKPELAKFTEQTGVKVNLRVIGWADLFNNITAATTSGKGPDVLNIGNTWSASLQATGAFLPFDGGALGQIGGKDKFLSTSFSATGAEGQTPTSVPLYGLAYTLFYNTKLFKQAGISSPPKTWSEFVADAKKLTKPPDQYGVTLEGGSISEGAHFAFILGQQLKHDLFEGDKPQFDAPEEVKAVKAYVDLIGDNKVVRPNDATYAQGPEASDLFAKGKTGMLISQNNTENNLKAAGMKDFAVADVPVLDGSSNPIMTHVAGINVSVFQNTKHKDAALAFVKFLTSPKEQVALNQQFNSLPVVKEAQSDPAFSSPNLKTYNAILADHAAPMPEIAQEGQMEQFIGAAVKSLIATAASKGSVSEAQVKAALSDANEKMAAAG
jgi:multiple sugar transport system substrate-binding protein